MRQYSPVFERKDAMLDGATSHVVIALLALAAGLGVSRLAAAKSKTSVVAGENSNNIVTTIVIIDNGGNRDLAQLIAEIGAGVDSPAARLLREAEDDLDDK